MNGRTRWIVPLVAGVVLGALLSSLASGLVAQGEGGDAAAEVLRARRIELVDARGNTRAQLAVESSGEAVLRLRDETGAIRVKVGASRSGSGLVLLNDRTEPGVQVLAGADGTMIRLAESGKEERVLAP